MSDADLTLRLLRKIDAKIDALDAKLTARIDGLDARMDGLDARLDAFEAKVDLRFTMLEQTVNAIAGQLLVMTQFVKIDLRVRKLEAHAK